jgi:hypothetical protein
MQKTIVILAHKPEDIWKYGVKLQHWMRMGGHLHFPAFSDLGTDCT